MDDFPSALWPEGTHLMLMRAALLDGPPAVAAFHEWGDNIVFDNLDPGSFRMLPLLRWNAARLGVKHPLMARLDSVCRFLLVETTMKLDVLRRLALALHEIRVPGLLLKGAALGQRYYPNPALRPMADCDLLIPHGAHGRALKELFAAGWRTKGDEPATRHYSADLWHPPFNTILVELHWRSGIQSTLREDRMAWAASEEAAFRGVPCRVFRPEDEIIHACRHGFNWTPEVPPMRWLADCAMIVRNAGRALDWDRLAARAHAMEETLCVRRSLEWLRRENAAPIPADALRKLRARTIRRRERRLYVLRSKPRDWGVAAMLYTVYLHREMRWLLWPLRPRRVLEYFAGQFALADHADILRYFIYHFRREARAHGRKRFETLLEILVLRLGMKRISSNWLHEGFAGMLEEPSGLCWSHHKLKLEGFTYALDGSATGPLRVTHRGRPLDSTRDQLIRVDIAKSRPDLPNTLNSGFAVLVDLPAGDCELLVEHKGAAGWEPLFEVRIGDLPFARETALMKLDAPRVAACNPDAMGAIHFSIDTGLVRALQQSVPMEVFVETGTFEGAGVREALPLFRKIYTIELSPELHRAAAEQFRDNESVDVILGDSPTTLETLRPRLEKEAALYWLDAHWCGGNAATAGENNQCPLLREIDAIGALNERSAILIDDARLFLAAPPAPHHAKDWPDFDSIARKLLAANPGHALAVIDDVIACVPRAALPALRAHARDHSPDLLVEFGKARQFDALKKDRDTLAADVEHLTAKLHEIETDSAARLEQINRLHEMLKATSEKLAVSEADRAARLEVIERQDRMLKEQAGQK